ncbi:hypothetical protein POM88_043816 [Heracleum sosnowskyi]|uniref:Replication protein A 70 kDa DNA-binding subunit B/D first OB fold domain-containing protein n=1 Tax=Heracleum sosnowskyi TaxID=360622 RepID=A0AAD8M4M2_9APIA|nr:hypothetical protein POM88_043816 [Heracleum sosnowskyi]
MELNNYDQIKNLKSSSYDWKIRVRLQAVWKGLNRETKEIYGLNMIFTDDSNARVHAFASKKFCENLLDKLIEGQIYILSNFKVKDFLGDEIYRPVRNKIHIFFTPHTKLEKDESNGLEIEDYAFDFYYMGEIEKLADDNRFLTDMVGKVENIQDGITTTKNNNETTRMKFEITDGRYRVKVTLFEEFGIRVEEQFKKLDPNDIFVIIASARVGRYDGAPNLTNYPATRVYVNPIHYSVKDLKTRKRFVGKMHAYGGRREKKFNSQTNQQLKQEFLKKQVECQVIVRKLEEKANWYYSKCTGCDIEIHRQNGIYKCNQCPGQRIIPYPDKRFRLCTVCSYNTGSIAIIFPDAEKYTITLQINEDNIEKGSTVYEAREILENMDVSDSFDPTKAEMVETHQDSEMKDVHVQESNNGTPQTGNSTNIKTRARKDLKPIAFGSKDLSEIPPMKNIKKEKVDHLQIKCRIIRKWRGCTRTGEEFKAFNVLLIDNMKTRIHAFIHGFCVDNLEDQIELDKVYTIKNFTVQNYKEADIYRCLRNEKQLIISKDTKFEEVEDKQSNIPSEMFDLYEHSELRSLAGHKTYLTDVVGIMTKYEFRDLKKE